MHKFIGMIAISAVVIVMAGSTRAGSPSSYTLTPAEPSNALTIQRVTPGTNSAQATTARPQLGQILYETQPIQQNEAEIFIADPVPVPDTGTFVITPAPTTAQ